MNRIGIYLAMAVLFVTLPGRAAALERICDPAYEDCRAPLLALIENESVAIDVAFWFMEDARYSAALYRALQRGVRVRVLWDSQSLDPSDPNWPTREFIVNQLRDARGPGGTVIPMIEKTSRGIQHWKMMLFAGQNTVQFSGANFSGEAFVFQVPYSSYVDEVIYFTDKQSLVDSFKRKFDDVWTDKGEFTNWANVSDDQRTREHLGPLLPLDPEMQFYTGFRERSVAAYRNECTGIDAIIYRITDRAHTDWLIEAVKRGVRVRLLTEQHQYSDPSRLWHRWNVDRLYMAGLQYPIDGRPGIEIRHRGHDGLLHEKLTLLHRQDPDRLCHAGGAYPPMTVFGSSNWTSPSSDSQLEHNLFTSDSTFYAWSRDHFDRKWFNLGPSPESKEFVPLPPDAPVLTEPSNGAANQSTSATLRWYGGPWGHRYDVYLGTSPAGMVKVLDDKELGPYYQFWTATGLAGGTTYYWRIVGRTMAGLSKTSATWSFTTAGVPTSNTPPTVALTGPANGTSYTAPAVIAFSANASDSDGTVVRVEFYAGSSLVGSDTTAPYGLTWNGVPAGTYTLTARAIDNAGAVATSSPVSVTVHSGTATPLPSPWAQQDIGAVGVAGSAGLSGGTWTVSGSGTDIWGSDDQFHYVYQPMTGDGSVVARVTTVQNADQWTKAGVMIRDTLSPGSKHAFMIVTPGGVRGLAFQRRVSTGGSSTHTSGGEGTAPAWVKLTRSGSTITAYRSANGVSWTLVGSDTIPMAATVHAGLAVTSHNNAVLASATFDNVEVTPDTGAPPPNVPPTVSLTSPTDGTTFSAPATINLAATAGDSDGSVTRVDFYSGSALVGSDTAAPYAITLNDMAAGTYTFTARATDSGGATTTSGAVTVTVAGGAPALPSPWEQRDIGSVGAAGDASLSGSTWTIRGSGADVWGTADAFHLVYQPITGDGSVIARVASVQNVDQWTKAGVMIRETLTAGSAHAFMIVTPGGVKGLAFQRRTSANGLSTHTSGGGGTAPAWVKLTRSGSTITAFRSADGMAWTLVGSDSFSMAGTVYVGLAITSHADGALASATFDNVSVVAGTAGPPPNTPPSVAITSPASGATFTAPATVTLSANASDPDGTVARVEFFSGATLIGTDTTSPYSITWSGVAAGTYTITARATDNAGAETTSSAVTLDVRPSGSEPGSLPSGWSSGDIGAVGAAGSAAHADGVFTIAGSGADIWDAADEFRFVYRTMTGDGTIVARVDSIEPVHQWTKAGVMIRAALTTGSRHAMMIASPGKGLAFQRRVADNGLSTHTAGAAVTAPVWVRLQRTGSTITASTSANGTTWTVVGSDTIAMPGTVFVGLPVTSHSDGVLATATISSVSVTP